MAAIFTHASPFYPPSPARVGSYSSGSVLGFVRGVNKVFIAIVSNHPVMSQVRSQAGVSLDASVAVCGKK